MSNQKSTKATGGTGTLYITNSAPMQGTSNPLVMIPGPTPVVRSIQDQMGRETIAFNDPRFIADFQDLLTRLKVLWRCDGLAFVVAGSGTMAMEMGIANITDKNDRVLVCSNGHFGDRYIDICARKGFHLDTLVAPWGKTITAEQIDEQLKKDKYTVLVVTHVETSTGVVLPLQEVCAMLKAKHPEVLFIVDGVAATAGVEEYMDWGIDILLSCTQKAFGVAPGLGIVWASQRAMARRKALPPIPESYVDFEKWIPVMENTLKYWGTPAVNMIWALKESVRIIEEETLDARYARHTRWGSLVQKSMAAIGFKTFAECGCQAPTLSVFLYPENSGIDDAKFREMLYKEGVHAAGCLGDIAGKGFRMGHMGNIDKHTLVSAIAAVERTCLRLGYKIQPGAALAVLQAGFAAE